jgi:hypothetical protein
MKLQYCASRKPKIESVLSENLFVNLGVSSRQLVHPLCKQVTQLQLQGSMRQDEFILRHWNVQLLQATM